MVGQQGVSGAQRHIERVVAVGGRHDMGSGIFTQGAQGRCIRADIGRHCSYSGGRLLERGPSMALNGHLRLTHTTVMGGAGGSL